MTESEILQVIQERLSRTYTIERMILFGSRANGTAHAESDFDVLVIAQSAVPFIQRQVEARLAIGDKDFPVDLLVYTPEEAQTAASVTGSAVYWALKEGRELSVSSR